MITFVLSGLATVFTKKFLEVLRLGHSRTFSSGSVEEGEEDLDRYICCGG